MVRTFLQVAAGAADIPVTRQSVDFAGLPEMARTFLQVAAGESDVRDSARHDRGAAERGTHADASAWDPTSTCVRSWSVSTG
ncbi:hypothetical protein D3273_08965 [Lichenibacterium minor]|uniref:Uncharacterized protein n=1 Tax=Lichenibacterium minor TaxID=2316528 RepID=A0A4Q2UBF8_9HYPH|nr:hypothetical protein [Lichenibacterium minor]RYC32507.1 hypothetical protein D3273_08965 [Lichenibacterium minor]